QRSPLMDIFVQGKIGMQVGLPPTVGQIEENNPDLNYEIVPIPTKDGSAFTLGVSDHLMAFKNDESKQEAITKFFASYFRAENYVAGVEAENLRRTTSAGSEALHDDVDRLPLLEVLPGAECHPSTIA